MFRRRFLPPRFRRPLHPAGQRALLRLQEAHRLLSEGNAAAAATIFEDLADQAAARAIPRAPQLCLQAGRAWILAGDLERGLGRLKLGLQMMARMGQTGRLPQVAGRVIAELRGRGLADQAAEVEEHVRALLPGLALPSRPSASVAPERRLPPKCPYCGGNVVPDSIEWADETSALCDYCGSVLQAEG
jgi:hypothetical protein